MKGPTAIASRRYVEHVMGMPISLALRGRHADTATGRTAWVAVMAQLAHADRVFSTYRPDSVISRLDRGEIDLEDCPGEVREVLTLGRSAAEVSGGAFSIYLPTDPAKPTGRRHLDPSGVVKGWAADRASAHLAALDDTDYCLSAGGDIVCRASLDRDPWRIGIENPHDATKIVAVVPLHGGAVATSGTTHRGAHLLDARTGRPPHGVASVTVIGPSLTWADIDATAAYAHGPRAASWLRGRPIHSALLIGPDGRMTRVVPLHGPDDDRSSVQDRRKKTAG
jgi:thiamine biosynthesis lipoprotein